MGAAGREPVRPGGGLRVGRKSCAHHASSVDQLRVHLVRYSELAAVRGFGPHGDADSCWRGRGLQQHGALGPVQSTALWRSKIEVAQTTQ